VSCSGGGTESLLSIDSGSSTNCGVSSLVDAVAVMEPLLVEVLAVEAAMCCVDCGILSGVIVIFSAARCMGSLTLEVEGVSLALLMPVLPMRARNATAFGFGLVCRDPCLAFS